MRLERACLAISWLAYQQVSFYPMRCDGTYSILAGISPASGSNWHTLDTSLKRRMPLGDEGSKVSRCVLFCTNSAMNLSTAVETLGLSAQACRQQPMMGKCCGCNQSNSSPAAIWQLSIKAWTATDVADGVVHIEYKSFPDCSLKMKTFRLYDCKVLNYIACQAVKLDPKQTDCTGCLIAI